MGISKKQRTEQAHRHAEDYVTAQVVKDRIQQHTFDRLVRQGMIIEAKQ